MPSPGQRSGEGAGAPAKPSAPAGWPVLRPAIVVVGASTGGPQALVALVEGLAPVLPQLSVCVTLHMPRDFVPVVAGQLSQRCRVGTRVVAEEGPLERGVVCFAPGDGHLDFRRAPAGVLVASTPVVPRGSCKPAVDNMFAAAAGVYGARTIGVVLSGMGEDGLAGAHAIARAGGTLFAQDERSSAVWGMPGALAKAGLASAVLPPAAIAGEIGRRLAMSGTLP